MVCLCSTQNLALGSEDLGFKSDFLLCLNAGGLPANPRPLKAQPPSLTYYIGIYSIYISPKNNDSVFTASMYMVTL